MASDAAMIAEISLSSAEARTVPVESHDRQIISIGPSFDMERFDLELPSNLEGNRIASIHGVDSAAAEEIQAPHTELIVQRPVRESKRQSRIMGPQPTRNEVARAEAEHSPLPQQRRRAISQHISSGSATVPAENLRARRQTVLVRNRNRGGSILGDRFFSRHQTVSKEPVFDLELLKNLEWGSELDAVDESRIAKIHGADSGAVEEIEATPTELRIQRPVRRSRTMRQSTIQKVSFSKQNDSMSDQTGSHPMGDQDAGHADLSSASELCVQEHEHLATSMSPHNPLPPSPPLSQPSRQAVRKRRNGSSFNLQLYQHIEVLVKVSV